MDLRRLQSKPVLGHVSVQSGDQMETTMTNRNLSPNQTQNQNLNQTRDLILPVRKAVQVMMKDQFQTEMKMEETLNKVIIVRFLRTESRLDLTTSSIIKKETSSTKIKTSLFKT